jgi:RHS repeat-associated protein
VLDGSLNIQGTYNYDADGNAIGFNPATAVTDLLYDGEQTDPLTGQIFLRQRYYDLSTGRFTTLDPYFGDLSNPLTLNKYLFGNANPVNFVDPVGASATANTVFGTDVHNFLNRAFEDYSPVVLGVGQFPGPRRGNPPAVQGNLARWSNREVRTIVKYLNPALGLWRVPPFTLRPDFVQVENMTDGTLYELKPLSLGNLVINGLTGLIDGEFQLLGYRMLLRIVAPAQTWSNGTSWLPGITTWPGFPEAPANHVLVTFDDYEDIPGLIFYNIMGITDTIETVMVGVAAGLAAAEIFLPGSVAVGGQAITQLAYSVAQIANDVGTFALSELEGEVGLAVAEDF